MWQFLKDFGVVSALGAALIAYLIKQWASVKALKLGLQALLRAQMISDYNRWQDREYAPIYARENFENCYKNYKALGADGVIDDIHEKFLQLPTEAKGDDR